MAARGFGRSRWGIDQKRLCCPATLGRSECRSSVASHARARKVRCLGCVVIQLQRPYPKVEQQPPLPAAFEIFGIPPPTTGCMHVKVISQRMSG